MPNTVVKGSNSRGAMGHTLGWSTILLSQPSNRYRISRPDNRTPGLNPATRRWLIEPLSSVIKSRRFYTPRDANHPLVSYFLVTNYRWYSHFYQARARLFAAISPIIKLICVIASAFVIDIVKHWCHSVRGAGLIPAHLITVRSSQNHFLVRCSMNFSDVASPNIYLPMKAHGAHRESTLPDTRTALLANKSFTEIATGDPTDMRLTRKSYRYFQPWPFSVEAFLIAASIQFIT